MSSFLGQGQVSIFGRWLIFLFWRVDLQRLLFSQIVVVVVAEVATASRDHFDLFAGFPLGGEGEGLVTHPSSFEQNTSVLYQEFMRKGSGARLFTNNSEIIEVVKVDGFDDFCGAV